jgi:hypothetical protein
VHARNMRGDDALVQHAQILVSLRISLIVLDRRLDPNGFECRFLPARDDVPAESTSCHVIKCAKAFGKKGGSKEVDAVMAKLRCFVTAAIADIGCHYQYLSNSHRCKHTIVGSVIGHCAALLIQLSKLSSYVSYPPYVSARKSALMPPRSRSFARLIQ